MAFLKPEVDNIPSELQARHQWVCWRTIIRYGKPTKPPCQSNGLLASSTNPKTWTDFSTARAAASRFDGVGFVLTESDPFVALDFDECHCPGLDGVFSIAGTLDMVQPEIAGHLRRLNAYTEVSPSGRGIRVILKGHLPVAGTKKGPIEAYQAGRYVTITGHTLDGFPLGIEDRSAELLAFYEAVFGKNDKGKEPEMVRKTSSGLMGPWRERLDRAIRSRNGAEIRRLLDGETSGDHSVDDLKLCGELAFWLDKDVAAMDQAFRASGLMRDKWDEKHRSDGATYGQMTIETAVAGCRSCYGDKSHAKRVPRPELVTTSEPRPEAAERIFPHTDMGNAERLVHWFGADIRYSPSRRRWLIWKNSHWQWDDINEIEKLAKLTIRAIFQEAVTARDDKVKDIGKHAVRSENAARIRAMIDLAQSETGVAVLPNELDRDPWMLNVANGTLDLRTGLLKPPTRGDMITRKIEVPYDPGAECPLWMKFLKTVMGGNARLIQFLQRTSGYSLTGDTREQVLFFPYGRGSNGKTTFTETMTRLMGTYSKHTRPETFMLKNSDSSANNDLADLEGCRLVAAVELEEGRRLAEVLTKQATGGDTLKARYLFQEYFEFRPQFKLWLCGNHKPRIQGTDLAIWRRIRLIPWTVTIPENQQDKELPEKLKNEWPGILAWAVKGCMAWQRDGLSAPPEVMAATADYRREMDILGDFFDTLVEVDSTGTTTVKSLFDAYVSHCEANGEPVKERLGKKKFNVRVAERGFDQFSGAGNVSTWIGMKLKS